MSDHIPFEIQMDIIKRLPIKSVMQFRSVSKTWKAQIDSSDFITSYNNQRQHLLVSCRVGLEREYFSFVDDDTFPQQKVPLTLPPSVADLAKHGYIVGSSHGLICLYAHDFSLRGSGTAVLWNPSIRKAVGVVVPNPEKEHFGPYLGFGVCRETTDPKIVKITHRDIIEVFALSEGVWRCPYNSFPPCISIDFGSVSVLIDGFLYWFATSRTGNVGSYRLIISFDITSEEFREVNLPESLAQYDRNLNISELKGSLVVLEHYDDDMYFDVWMMEDGVSNSFTKLYGICTPDVYARVFSGVLSVLAFRKSGEAIIEIIDYRREQQLEYSSDEPDPTTAVYDLNSKQIDDLGVVGNMYDFGGYHYIETLLLLDQPDSLIYDQGKRYVSKRRAKKRRI